MWNTRSTAFSLEEARAIINSYALPTAGKRREDFEFRIVRVTTEVVE